MKSYQNLVLLQNLYRLKLLGFNYIDPFSINTESLIIKPKNIDELNKNIESCHLCDLSKSRKQAMCGIGNNFAKLMIIDFSVSSNDNSLNSYYNGKSGDSLKKMVENILELDISNIYFTHMVKCKPLNANLPSLSEWNSCKQYLFSQIDFIKPKVIVILGEMAYNFFTNEDGNFESVRGHIIDYKDYKLIPIYHPQYLLRNPEKKKTTLKDLKTIKSCL